MTCMRESHLAKFDRSCNSCQNELKEYVKKGLITQKKYDSWMNGKTEIKNRAYRSFVR